MNSGIADLKDAINEIVDLKDEIAKMRKQISFMEKEINDLKISISKNEISSVFNQPLQIQKFNQLNGDDQMQIITEISNNDCANKDIQNLSHLLSFLSSENKKINNQEISYIYFPFDGIKKKSLSKIGITTSATEMLYQNNALNSKSFHILIKSFPEFEIQIKYPSLNFDGIYNDIENLKNAKIGNIFISILISGVQITDKKFKNNKSIDSLIFDYSVKVINGSNYSGSFQGCTSLKYVEIPTSVVSIDPFAFRECSSLEEIVIPSSVKAIGNFAFSRCFSLRKISISSSVKEIGSFCFSECTSLTHIFIPFSVKDFGKSILSKCTSLKEITIPSTANSKEILGINSNVKITKLY